MKASVFIALLSFFTVFANNILAADITDHSMSTTGIVIGVAFIGTGLYIIRTSGLTLINRRQLDIENPLPQNLRHHRNNDGRLIIGGLITSAFGCFVTYTSTNLPQNYPL